DRPVAGKTGTSENFFDAWFVGYVPQMVTGIWMGYGEGGANLEYTLDYARKLNGLSGGITPAEIWRTYMQDTMAGQPIEDFEGVEVPKDPVETTGPTEALSDNEPETPPVAPETTAPNAITTASPPPEESVAIPPPNASSAPPEEPGVVPPPITSSSPSSAAPSSAAPASAEPTYATPASAPAASPAPR
nr:hypothetical protein [Rubrobacteraceae bacterium]